ncbi:MAG: FAD-binding protein [Deltaproteobacteria bacterium]|nr:FAD-binding protein [Deltaproteobacteria bacterium]
MGNILVLAEQRDGVLRTATLNAVTFAQKVAAQRGTGYEILVIGAGVQAAAAEAAKFGAAKVHVVDGPLFDHYLAQSFSFVAAEVAKAAGASLVCAAATTTGKDCLPRVAARLGAGMASDVVGIGAGAGTFLRPTWAGNILEEVRIETPVQVVSVRPTDFDKAAPAGAASPVQAFATTWTGAGMKQRFVAFKATESSRPDLAEARVVVAGGRGLKAKENFRIIEALADVLGGAVGATRAAVDAEFIENDYQIGQTGKVCAPDLYIGAGISGAIQHLAGMKNSKVIVAINKDEEAPIFSVADYGLVADLFKVVPELTEAVKKVKGR